MFQSPGEQLRIGDDEEAWAKDEVSQRLATLERHLHRQDKEQRRLSQLEKLAEVILSLYDPLKSLFS